MTLINHPTGGSFEGAGCIQPHALPIAPTGSTRFPVAEWCPLFIFVGKGVSLKVNQPKTDAAFFSMEPHWASVPQ